MQVEKFLKNIKRADPNKAMQGGFFLKINKLAEKIPIHMQENKCARGFFFSKAINMQTKKRLCRGNFFLKLINVHGRLFGTLEQVGKNTKK